MYVIKQKKAIIVTVRHCLGTVFVRMKSKVSVHTRLNHALNELEEILTTYFIAKHPYNEKGKKANQLLEKLYFSNSIEIMYLYVFTVTTRRKCMQVIKQKRAIIVTIRHCLGLLLVYNKRKELMYVIKQKKVIIVTVRHCLGPVFVRMIERYQSIQD